MEIKDFTLKIKNKILFDNISFSIKEGSLNILAGKNGVGKSVLIDLISDLDKNRPNDFIGFPESKKMIYQTQGVPFIAEATVKQTLRLLSNIAGNDCDLLDLAPAKIKKT